MNETGKIRAIGLLSGGLDSSLALQLIQSLDIEVRALTFHTGFCFADTRRADRRKDKSRPLHQGPGDAKQAVARTETPLEIVDISDEYLQVLHHPKHGYGHNVNPCIDCRIHMFTQAKWYMEQYDAQFVFTGEVLGQRPMSQHYRQLMLISEQSGLGGLLLRPLSAQHLPPTIPEKEGWVDRSKLLGLHGRNRKPQMALAREWGLTEFPQPAGGCCFLTEPQYGRKVKELWNHTYNKDSLHWEDYILLKTGRHFRVDGGLKVIVGRDEGENSFLASYAKGKIRIEPETVNGPTSVIDADCTEQDILTAARITASYCDVADPAVEVGLIITKGDNSRVVRVIPFTRQEIAPWLII